MLRSSDWRYNNGSRERDKINAIEEFILIVIFTALSALIRFWKLGTWSFWADEIFSVQDAMKFPDQLTINPLIYFLINKTTSIFGISEWSARLGPCIIGILSIPIIYWISKMMFNARTGIIVSSLLVFHPWHIFWSQNARAYSMAFLFAGLASFLFFQAIEKDSIGYIISAFLATVLSISAYMQSILLLPVFLGYVLLLPFLPINMPKGLNGKNLIIFFGPFLVAAISLFLESVRSYIYSGWGSNEWGRSYLYILFTVIYSTSIPLTTASFVAGLHSLAYLNRGGLFLICYCIIPLAILMIISPFLNVAGYYLFFTMPAYLILAGFCVSELSAQMPRATKALSASLYLVLLISLISQSYLYFFKENGGREKWQDAFASISDINDKQSIIITTIPRIAQYYIKRDDAIQLEGVMPRLNVLQTQWSQKNVWFVLDEPSVNVLDPNGKFREWLYDNCKMYKQFPVYARVMDRTISVWRLIKQQPVTGNIIGTKEADTYEQKTDSDRSDLNLGVENIE